MTLLMPFFISVEDNAEENVANLVVTEMDECPEDASVILNDAPTVELTETPMPSPLLDFEETELNIETMIKAEPNESSLNLQLSPESIKPSTSTAEVDPDPDASAAVLRVVEKAKKKKSTC